MPTGGERLCHTPTDTHENKHAEGGKVKCLRRNSPLKYSWRPHLHSKTHACDSSKSYSSLFGGLYLTQAFSSLVAVVVSGCFRGRVGEKKGGMIGWWGTLSLIK